MTRCRDPRAHPSADQRRSLRAFTARAAERIDRRRPDEALAESARDAVLIDIRSSDARRALGVIPGSLHIPRTVLEWRVALDSPWRSPFLGGADEQLILICDHGYSSILAAGNLVDLGFTRAGDLIGGFASWLEMDLPVIPCADSDRPPEQLPGTFPPEPPLTIEGRDRVP